MSASKTIQKLQIIESDGDNCVTFELQDEDHTLGNSLRYMIMKDPNVKFCGYSMSHPNERKVRLQIQTFNQKSSPLEVLELGLKNLIQLTNHIKETFNSTLENYLDSHQTEQVKMESQNE